MSIIAKSLKKIKSSGKKDKAGSTVSFSKSSYFNLGFYIIITLLILILIAFIVNFFIFLKKNGENIKLSVKTYEKTFLSVSKKFSAKNKDKEIENKLKYFLITGKKENMKKLLNKIKSGKSPLFLKYSGILDFKNGKYDSAYKYLTEYIRKRKGDNEAISYLSEILVKKHEYGKALDLYKMVKLDDFETNYNKAVILELMGKYREALNYYKKSFLLSQDMLLKRRIYNKIFLLEHYE